MLIGPVVGPLILKALALFFLTWALAGAAIGVVVGAVSYAVFENGRRSILRSAMIASPVFTLSVWALIALGPRTTMPFTINHVDGTSSTVMQTAFHGEPHYLAGLVAMVVSLSVEASVRRTRHKRSVSFGNGVQKAGRP